MSKFQFQDKSLYSKFTDIKNPSIYENYVTDQSQYGVGVHFMVFSNDENYLLLYYQLIDNQHLRINNDPNGLFVLWDLNNNNSVKNWDLMKKIKWDKLNFPNSIDAINIKHPKINIEHDLDRNQEDKVNMTAMYNSQNFLFLGNSQGNIHFAKLYAIQNNNSNNEFNKMCLGKSQSAHFSFINQIEYVQKFFNYLVICSPRVFLTSAWWSGK